MGIHGAMFPFGDTVRAREPQRVRDLLLHESFVNTEVFEIVRDGLHVSHDEWITTIIREVEMSLWVTFSGRTLPLRHE